AAPHPLRLALDAGSRTTGLALLTQPKTPTAPSAAAAAGGVLWAGSCTTGDRSSTSGWWRGQPCAALAASATHAPAGQGDPPQHRRRRLLPTPEGGGSHAGDLMSRTALARGNGVRYVRVSNQRCIEVCGAACCGMRYLLGVIPAEGVRLRSDM